MNNHQSDQRAADMTLTPNDRNAQNLTEVFPELAHLDTMDDEQQLQAFTSVLDQLHHRLDEVTGR